MEYSGHKPNIFVRIASNRVWLAFGAAFAIMLITLLPMMIVGNGVFTYYGDYNSQEIPFYYHVNEAIREGGLFSFDWGTDLGSDLFTSYTFYNTGSVFFYLTLLLPQSWVIYSMPVLMALKTAVAAAAAFAFAKRFVKSDSAAFIASMLYAFSGALCYDFFFYHFHDAAAFFPLMLLALEQYVNDSRRGVLALTVALCAFTNYYFFISEGIFFLVYFIVRIISRHDGFDINIKKFFGVCLECAIGIMLAGVLLVPSALAIINNPRLGSELSGLDILVYSDKYRLLRIIQSFFMMPDPPARSNLFSTDSANWASVAAYLPAFSMVGVIAFLRSKKKSFLKNLCIVLFVIAFVPILNSAFQLFNTTYYARWFYSFDLILAVMTACCFDGSKDIELKKGVLPTAVGIAVFVLIFFLPTKNDDGEWEFFLMAKYGEVFALELVITVLLLVSMLFFIKYVRDKGFGNRYIAFATAICCMVYLASCIFYGISQGPYPETYRENTVNADINLPDTGEFYRIETSENTDNYPMLWGYSTIRCFNSNVSTSIMEFYESLGITRDVASRPETEYISLRSLLSVKYYLDLVDEDGNSDFDEKGFTQIDTQGNFKVYENENYLPMGILFDTYITEDVFSEYSTYQKCQLLMYALVLSDEDVENADDSISELERPKAVFNTYALDSAAEALRENTCYEFEESSSGFTAKINADKGGLLMFSVPYDEGFTAYVNGEQAEILKVDNGLSAVYVSEGESEIIFDYETYGLKEGAAITAAGAAGFAVYIAVVAIVRRKRKCI